VFGSYLHGPLLARNTALADLLLGWATAPSGSAEPPSLVALDDTEEEALRHERLTALPPSPSRLVRLVRGRP
jgi:lipid II isoglutaminyl synthase (glutamine-hydrolysing)